jgi:hypothetical protein
MRAAIFLSLLVTAGHVIAAGGFFFDGQPEGRRTAIITKDKREKLLRDAYACNKPNKSLEEQNECQAHEEAARTAMNELIRANHQAAQPMIEEARRINNRQLWQK